jgi:hypothetical protein
MLLLIQWSEPSAMFPAKSGFHADRVKFPLDALVGGFFTTSPLSISRAFRCRWASSATSRLKVHLGENMAIPDVANYSRMSLSPFCGRMAQIGFRQPREVAIIIEGEV